VSNDLKVANLLSASRMAALTGNGGYLTPAAQGATFAFPVGGEWTNAPAVGLKVVNSNTNGADVSLPSGGTWSHNLHVDTGAELVATGVSANGPARVSGVGTITSGAGASGLTIGGTATLTPGFASTGILTSNGDIALAPLSHFEVGLGGTVAGALYDQLNVLGAVTLQNTAAAPILDASLNYDPTPGDQLAIVRNDGSDPVTGIFAGLPEGAPVTLVNPATSNSFTFNISYTGNADGGPVGNDVTLTAAGVPEPTGVGAIAVAGAAMAMRRRRRGC
jgi:hypothetical protein